MIGSALLFCLLKGRQEQRPLFNSWLILASEYCEYQIEVLHDTFLYSSLSFLSPNMWCNGKIHASLICRLLYHEADSRIFSQLAVQLFFSISDFLNLVDSPTSVY